jgi:hypothetical protein
MSDGNGVARNRQKRIGIILMLTSLLLVSAAPGHAWHGAHVFVAPTIVAPFGPFWTPYWGPYAYPYPYAYPPVVVQSSPQVDVQPPPLPPAWYYCDNPQGYYPYVQQCPGGWRQVTPTPQ